MRPGSLRGTEVFNVCLLLWILEAFGRIRLACPAFGYQSWPCAVMLNQKYLNLFINVLYGSVMLNEKINYAVAFLNA